jgi:hypothetical protein
MRTCRRPCGKVRASDDVRSATGMLVARQIQNLIWSGLGTGARRWWPGLRAARLADPSSAVVAGAALIAGYPRDCPAGTRRHRMRRRVTKRRKRDGNDRGPIRTWDALVARRVNGRMWLCERTVDRSGLRADVSQVCPGPRP